MGVKTLVKFIWLIETKCVYLIWRWRGFESALVGYLI